MTRTTAKRTTPSSPVGTLTLAKGLSIDADYLAGSSVALLGKRGSGKTYSCRAIAEELHDAAVQTIIVDPMGVFWGLRSDANGKKGGLPIPVFGGEHGDAPLESSAGTLMADLAVDEGLSMVLDLSGFPSRTQERTFAREFFDRLYRRNRTLVHVIVDEADLFSPQKPRREDAPLLVTMENLVRRGRNKGIGVTMASQRPATINKDVLTQVDALVAMRVTAPQDRDAIRDWVRGQGTDEQWQEIAPSLPSLATGEAWWWVPEQGILKKAQGRRTRTFDSSPTKKRGQEAHAPKTFADVDLSDITERMKATIERAESSDPKALNRRIRELEAELAKSQKTAAAAPAPEVEVHEVSVLSDEDRELLRQAVAGFQSSQDALDRVRSTLVEQAEVISGHGETVQTISERALADDEPQPTGNGSQRAPRPASPAPASHPASAPRAAPARNQQRPTEDADGHTKGDVSPARRRILDALADLAGIGVTVAPKTQVSLWAGTSPKSSGYANNLGGLRSQGLIEYPLGGHVALTEAGWEQVSPGAGEHPVSTAELHEKVAALVSPARWRILAPLVAAYPKSMTREQLAEEAGISGSSSGYANNLGALRSLGLLDYPVPGQVVASAMLFLDQAAAV